jgi:hypothetical protein
MYKIKNKTGREACRKVALDNLLPSKVVEEIIYQYYNMIASEIKESSIDSPESFKNFNLPKIGKLYVSKNKLNRKINGSTKS